MVLAGYASTMNTWIDSIDHFQYSLNDFYMVGLMTAWMFFFMGLLGNNNAHLVFGMLFVILFFYLIRTQAFVSEKSYLRGMIPHHSMAIMMSKRLKEKPNTIQSLLDSIISTQRKEIMFMKSKLRV
jgi:hypothetical protein